MTGYTKKNLREVEDMAPRFGLAPDLEARFARRDLRAEQVGLSYQRLAPDAKGAFGHSHTEDEEIYLVVSGSGRMMVGDETVEISAWDAIRVAPETVRAFAAGPDGLELLAFGTHTEDDASVQQVEWTD
jgi:mannose-6-phosphate isomerase-like protein (cupin superfamily)